jgi:mRNA-degrading endonuclease RelE of RelBE toxin-antitoxin system
MRECSAYFSKEAAETIVSLSRRRQQKLVDICIQLARNPSVKADYSVKDSEGRDVEHLRIGEFVIAYWVDAPACKVMIVEIDHLR